MNKETISALAGELTPGGPGGQQPPLRFRQGSVVSVQADGTATVTIGGDATQIAGVKVASHVCPLPNASCWMVVDGRDLFVIATIAPAGPAWATMRKSTAQTIGPSSFTALTWGSRTGVASAGVTLGSSGVTIIVPGLYQLTGSAHFDGTGTGARLARLTRNGTAVSQGQLFGSLSSLAARLNVSTIAQCAIGDVLNVEVWHNSSGDVATVVGDGSNMMSVAWLGPAA